MGSRGCGSRGGAVGVVERMESKWAASSSETRRERSILIGAMGCKKGMRKNEKYVKINCTNEYS